MLRMKATDRQITRQELLKQLEAQIPENGEVVLLRADRPEEPLPPKPEDEGFRRFAPGRVITITLRIEVEPAGDGAEGPPPPGEIAT